MKLFKSNLKDWLGYRTKGEMWDNTIFVYFEPPDTGWFATLLPNKTWVVWNDANLFSQISYFPTWKETISHLWNNFKKSNYPLDYWSINDIESDDDLLCEPKFKKYQNTRWYDYPTEEEMWNNTICVYLEPPDAGWFATRLPDNIWVVWNDANLLPVFLYFRDWKYAVTYLWNRFNKSNHPSQYWNPDDFERSHNILIEEPDLKKYQNRFE